MFLLLSELWLNQIVGVEIQFAISQSSNIYLRKLLHCESANTPEVAEIKRNRINIVVKFSKI